MQEKQETGHRKYMKRKRIIIILGMHRSGTSLTAQLICKMGAYIGDSTDLFEISADNEDGYFENRRIVDIDNEVLHYYGGSGGMTEEIDFAHEDLPVRELRIRLESVINELLMRSDYVCIKDPRISLLLPFWERAVSEIDADIKYVYPIRNPDECATSLSKRDGFKMSISMLLWRIYNRNIQMFLYDKEYFKIYYNELMDGKTDLKALHDYAFGSDYCFNHSELIGCIKSRLYHNRIETVSAEQEMLYNCKLNYDELRNMHVQRRNILYIHIGTNKTGSSAIQAFLMDNPDYLNEYGVCYPMLAAQKGNKYREAPGNACELSHLNPSDIYDRYYDLYKKDSYKKKDIILSAEAYWHILDKTEYFEQIKRLPYQIKVIVYLRRQDDYLSATINQRIKSHHFTIYQYPECMSESYNVNIKLNYYDELEKIAKVIGRENIIVRKYSKDMDTVSDFLDILGIPMSSNCNMPPKVVNPHLSKKGVKVMCMLNKTNPPQKIYNFIRRILIDSNVKNGKYKENLFLWDEETRAKILEDCAESNSKLEKVYLRGETFVG